MAGSSAVAHKCIKPRRALTPTTDYCDAESAIKQFSSAIQVNPRGAAGDVNRAEVICP